MTMNKKLLSFTFGGAIVAVAFTFLGASISASAAACTPGPNADLTGCNFSGQDLSAANLSGTNLSGADLSGANLTGLDLRTTNLTNTNLNGANLSRSNLSGLGFGPLAVANTNFTGADLSGTRFTNWLIDSVNFHNANLAGANFYTASMQAVDISGANVSGTNFSSTRMNHTVSKNLTGTPLVSSPFQRFISGCIVGPDFDISGANLSGANLDGFTFAGANLAGTNFTNASLRNTTIQSSNIDGAIFTGADFLGLSGIRNSGVATLPSSWVARGDFLAGPGANLNGGLQKGFSLANVDFSGIDLTGAELNSTDLSGANFRNSNLTGAWIGASSIDGTNFTGANMTNIRPFQGGGTPVTDPGWKMVNGYLVGPKADLSQIYFGGTWVYSPDFTGADLSGANLEYSNLDYANLKSVKVEGADFKGARALKVTSGGVTGRPAVLPPGMNVGGGYFIGQSSDLTNTNLSGADLQNVDWTGVTLTGADLTGANLRGATGLATIDGGLSAVKLPVGWGLMGGILPAPRWYLVGPGAILTGDFCSGIYGNVDFTDVVSGQMQGGCNPTSGGWSLRGSYLVGPRVNLQGANLERSSFVGVDLSGANLANANLGGADFAKANLTGANLTGANLTGANLTGTQFGSADLSNATLTNAGGIHPDASTGQYGGITGSPTLPAGWHIIGGYLFGPSAANERISISGLDLSGLDLSHADFYAANFSSVNMSGTNLSSAMLDYLQSANISGDPLLPSKFLMMSGSILQKYPDGVSASVTWDKPSLQIGAKLTAAAGGNVLGGTTWSFQWARDGIAITGATAPTYTVTIEDAGHTLSVTLTSSLPTYAPFTTAPWSSTIPALDQTLKPIPSLSTNPKVGQLVTAVRGTWDSGVTTACTWLLDGTEIPGATGCSYSPTAADLGHTLTVAVTGSLLGYYSSTQTSPNQVVGPGQLAQTPTPNMTGAVKVGATISANPGTWDTGVALSYQWLIDGVPVPGATSSQFTISLDNFGHALSISAKGNKAGYESVTKVSSVTQVSAGDMTLTPNPTLGGSPGLGSSLNVLAGTWDAGVTLTYQWLRDGQAIPSETSLSYTLLRTDVGHLISVSVTASKTGFSTVTKTSTQVSIAAAALTLTPTPTTTGTFKTGETVTAILGTWDAGVSLSYQWLRDGSEIPGATQPSYVVVGADFGHRLSVKVRGSATGYATSTQVSGETAVQQSSFSASGTPTIAGTAKTGASLTVSVGDWDQRATLSYQWLADGAPIPGATGNSYTLRSSDVGHAVSVAVTGSALGFESITQTSTALTSALGELTSTPIPVISGSLASGQTVRVNPGTWDSGVTLQYQWLRDGKAIPGATAESLAILVEDIGHTFAVQVTGTASGFNSRTQVSSPLIAAAKAQTSTPTPLVNGKSAVGSRLTVDAGKWDSGVTLSYQWLRDGSPIAGAVQNTYDPTTEDLGHQLRVAVSGTAEGYAPALILSQPQAVVAGTIVTAPTPVVSGIPKAGNTISVTTGQWDSGVAVSVQWLIDGAPIAGKTGLSFDLGNDLIGHRVSVAVTGSMTGFDSLTKTSSQQKILAPVLAPFKVTITGQFIAGKALQAKVTGLSAGALVRYQWLMDGKKITGATNPKYTLPKSASKHKVALKVTEALAGYTDLVLTTPQTMTK